MPPSSESEVRSRARKRFFLAFLWAVGIYSLLGYVHAFDLRPLSVIVAYWTALCQIDC